MRQDRTVIIILLFTIPGICTRPLSEEELLWKILFDGYNPSARPVMNSSATVSVAMQFSLMHIKELDVRSQVLMTTGLLILEWRDERLTWLPGDYGNMSELIVEASNLWKPEFAVINGAEKIYEGYDNFRAIVQSNGLVRWEPGGVFKTMCQIDITYYPFDEQVCELMFGAWSYHTSKMNLTNMEEKINVDSYKLNGEWEIIDTEVRRREFNYACCPDEKFSNVAFAVFMRRRHTFYIMNVILPSILTSVLLLSIFFCTPGQKVQIGVVVLLSFRIFLLNVADNIPKTSDHIPLLGIYLTCTMAVTTLSMVLTVFVLNLHHINDKPVPRLLRRVVLVYLGKMLGVGPSTSSKTVHAPSIPLTPGKVTKPRNHRTVSAPLDRGVDLDSDNSKLTIELNGDCKPCKVTESVHSKIEARTETSLGRGLSDYKDYSKDWKNVAEVFDRLFFWLFLLAILISTLILFHPLIDAYMRKG